MRHTHLNGRRVRVESIEDGRYSVYDTTNHASRRLLVKPSNLFSTDGSATAPATDTRVRGVAARAQRIQPPESRHPSPIKGAVRAAGTHAHKTHQCTDNNQAEQCTDSVGCQSEIERCVALVNETANYADGLIDDKKAAEEDYARQLATLPFLGPGQSISTNDPIMGFRVADGYGLAYDIDRIIVESQRKRPYDSEKIRAYITKWPSGFSWMYWTDATFGPEELTLGECAIRFGLGIYSNKNGCKTKKIFLDNTTSQSNSFLIAVVADEQGQTQVMSRQKETDGSVYRVWRSEIPDDIKHIISCRELINVRQGSAHIRWWEM